MSWQKELRSLASKHFMYFHRDRSILEYVTDDFKIQYPGNYVIEEYYDTKTMKFNLRLKFENEQDELLWKIKWS